MDTVLKTVNLTKRYKEKIAVNNLNINIKKGEIYGFLGKNGAGKTTSIKMLLGLISPSSGDIFLFGERILPGDYKHFRNIGSIVEIPGYYPNLTAWENLDIHRRMMHIKDRDCIDRALEEAGILEVRNKKLKNLSLGMKQRLGIARSLLNGPELLILDEPVNSLDPIGIKEVRKLILDLSKRRNITVFISSHILSEIEHLAARIGIIHQGCLIEEIDYNSLQKKYEQYLEVTTSDAAKAAAVLKQRLAAGKCIVQDLEVLRIYQPDIDAERIVGVLYENNLGVREITIKKDSLEDYFVKVTGGEAGD